MQLISIQILAITCNNASSNDRMVLELEDKVDCFSGQAVQARCFLHVGNLVAKTFVRAFDLPKGSKHQDDDNTGIVDDDELQYLSEDLNIENWQTITENDDDPTDNDDTEGWIDEIPLLGARERADLENRVQPVQIALAKVR